VVTILYAANVSDSHPFSVRALAFTTLVSVFLMILPTLLIFLVTCLLTAIPARGHRLAQREISNTVDCFLRPCRCRHWWRKRIFFVGCDVDTAEPAVCLGRIGGRARLLVRCGKACRPGAIEHAGLASRECSGGSEAAEGCSQRPQRGQFAGVADLRMQHHVRGSELRQIMRRSDVDQS